MCMYLIIAFQNMWSKVDRIKREIKIFTVAVRDFTQLSNRLSGKSVRIYKIYKPNWPIDIKDTFLSEY